jgi:hypothetical protein
MMMRCSLFGFITAIAMSSSSFGQIADNTVYFDFDFTANDQIVSAPDNDGAFTEGPMSDGPFTDGNLVGGGGNVGQQNFGGNANNNIWTVDTTAGTATNAGPSGAF